MPTTLPVPSKGALRTLRNLALGTSCTLAFGTGMLTEDRRRRIHAAREVYENGQRIRSARNYTGASNILASTLGHQAISNGDTILLAGDPMLKKLTRETNEAMEQKNFESVVDSKPSQIPRVPGRLFWNAELKRNPTPTLKFMPKPSLQLDPLDARDPILARQHRLASDVKTLLMDGDDLMDTEAAALRFIEAFEEGLEIPDTGMMAGLVNVAASVSKACMAQSKLDYSERIVDIIIKHTPSNPPLSEAQFLLFSPHKICWGLLDRCVDSPATDSLLRKAASIFMLKFPGEGQISPAERHQILSLGERLCSETCRRGLYNLTIDLYFRLQTYHTSSPYRATNHLIVAAHALGRHKVVFRYFRAYYSETSPDPTEFYTICKLVVESILETGNMDRAEKMLKIASAMAERGGFQNTTTPILQVIGHKWRSTRNLKQTRELFERLEPIVPLARHPKAIYGAIIQSCIEAGDEEAALMYYEKLSESYKPSPKDVRIYGHFALAKAKRGDWKAASQDLRNAAIFCADFKDEFTSCFVPILKLFGESHTASEAEEFLRGFVDENLITITHFISNTMIQIYADAKEISSLTGWIEYAKSIGCPIDSVSVNIILHYCHKKWNFSFADTYSMYTKIRKFDKSSQNMTDYRTLETLHRIAISGDPSPETIARRLDMLGTLRKKRSSWNAEEVHRAVRVTRAKNDPPATLRVYASACDNGIQLNPKCLAAVAEASLQVHPDDPKKTIDLIRTAKNEGQDVEPAVSVVIVHRMTALFESGHDAGEISLFYERTVNELKEIGVSVTLGVLTHSVSLLVRRKKFNQAIHLWGAMSHGQNIQLSSIDLPTLHVLFQAYNGLQHHRGISWVASLLQKNGLVPDLNFVLCIKRLLGEAMGLWSSNGRPSQSKAYIASLRRLRALSYTLRADNEAGKAKIQSEVLGLLEATIHNQSTTRGEAAKLPIYEGSKNKTAKHLVSIPDMDLGPDLAHQSVDSGEESQSENLIVFSGG